MKTKIESESGSTRITLRVSKECSEDIVWLANALGIEQKEVFGRIAGKQFMEEKAGRLLAALAQATKEASGADRVRKAQVVSRNTHSVLNSLAKKYGVARDDLVEAMVFIMKAMLDESLKGNRAKHKEALKILENFEKITGETENRLADLLGDDDPVYIRFRFVGTILMNLFMAINAEIEKGTPIDPDDMGQQG